MTDDLVIRTLETPSLGDRSYVASDGLVAIVLDPQRDIDRVLAVLDELAVPVSHVFETHVHNDYVSGGLELARRIGAGYVLPAGAGVRFDHTAVDDGDEIATGTMRVRALRTPGHTHHHTSYALSRGGHVRAVFTGGSMLFGATGRTDLVRPEDTEELTRAQYRSVRRLAGDLPAAARVLPTHGFGSFCSATPTSGDESTIGEQRTANPALHQDEQDFVEQLISGLDAYPAYYAHMAALNVAGPASVDLSLPRPVDPVEVLARIDAGEWVVDLRSRTAFAAGHLAGTLSFELSDNFVTYLGWLWPWGSPLTLIGETTEQVRQARRELVRIGVDRLAGASVGDPIHGYDPRLVRSYRMVDFVELHAALKEGPQTVLDVRRNGERSGSAIPGSRHVPIHELHARRDEVPAGRVWVHCASGYRASVAASMLDDGTRQLIVVSDDFEVAERLGLATSPD